MAAATEYASTVRCYSLILKRVKRRRVTTVAVLACEWRHYPPMIFTKLMGDFLDEKHMLSLPVRTISKLK
ncbi:MAG: hypothetical protein ACTS73_07480 [Arsenophonus sp. NEOnobi-MAG3]